MLLNVGMIDDIEMTDELEAPTLFIFDEDDLTRRKLLKMLGGAGFAVTSFSDLDKLVQSLRPQFPLCVIIADQQGGLDIGAVSGQIKKINKQLPLLLISPNANIKSAVEAIRNGANDLIESPYVDRILIEKLNHIIGL